MRATLATTIKCLLGLTLVASSIATPEPKRGRGSSGLGGDDEEEEEEEGVCTTEVVETRTAANFPVRVTMVLTTPCLTASATATSTSQAGLMSLITPSAAAAAFPTGAVEARYLIGAVGVGAAIIAM